MQSTKIFWRFQPWITVAALAEQPFTMKNPPLIGGGFHSHGGTPQKWMVDFRENPSKMDDDLGVPPFMETPRWFSFQNLHLRRPCFSQCLIAGGYACSKGQSYSGCWVSIQSLWEQKSSRMFWWNLAPCITELVGLVWWMAATMHHISVVDHVYVELCGIADSIASLSPVQLWKYKESWTCVYSEKEMSCT